MSEQRVKDIVIEAVRELGGAVRAVGNKEIHDWIEENYPGTNPRTTSAMLVLLAVNRQSRLHHSVNRIPRLKPDPEYDALFAVDRGKYRLYDPEEHGVWGIVREDGKLKVRKLEPHVVQVHERSLEKVRDELAAAQKTLGALLMEYRSADHPVVQNQMRLIELLEMELNDLEGNGALTRENTKLLMSMYELAVEALNAREGDLPVTEEQLWGLIKTLRKGSP